MKNSTPIMMLTAKAQEMDRSRAREAGARYFMPKPFSPTELLQIVEGILGEKKKFVNLSIKDKYFRIISGLFVLIVLTGLLLFFYISSQQNKLSHDREVLQNKAETINELATTLNDVFFG